MRGHGLGSSSWWRPRAGGVRPHSLWWARQARGMCDGEGTAMCGEPRVAAECTCTAREFGRCSRPTVRPGRNVHDERDHGDGSSTRPRGRRPSGSLTETRVRDGQYWSARFGGSADRTMNPCPLDGTDPRARTVLAACVEPDGPVDANGDQALVIDRCAPPGLPGRWRGGTAVGRDHRGASATAETPPVLVAEARGPPLPRSPPRPAVPGVVSMSVPPPPNGVRGATRAMRRHGRRVARADETRDRRPDVGLRASLRQMVTP